MMLKEWEIKSLTDASNERILQHLVWKYLEEDRGYEVNGEVTLPNGKRPDLVCKDRKNDLLCGIEIKRKKKDSISNNEISRIQRNYLRPGYFDDFKVFFENVTKNEKKIWKDGRKIEDRETQKSRRKIERIPYEVEFIDSEVTPEETPPYYDFAIYRLLRRNVTVNKNLSSKEEVSYQDKNEIWYEHKIWKALRDEGKLVLPNVTFPDKEGEVDLFVRSETEILALEVKTPRGRIKDEQIRRYESYRDDEAEVPVKPRFVVPREIENKARNKLNERDVDFIPFQKYHERTITLDDFSKSSEDLALERFENKE